jgi:aminopeptidase YwaD
MPTPADVARTRIDTLCFTHPDRHVGGAGNHHAVEFFAREAEAAGFTVERIPFDCVDWEYTGAYLTAGDTTFDLHAGPYSPPFSGTARLVAASTLAELEQTEAQGAILLLHGGIAAEQLTPRNYPFYQMESHVALLAALDQAAPAAIIAATDRTPMAAALHPFPLFEDAELGYPSAYLLHTQAPALLKHAGTQVALEIDSRQVQANGEQLVARREGRGPGRVLVSAHIDSRHGTPGALDNATGVAVLLALADVLSATAPRVAVELLPFNGEDNFAAYGEVAYLGRHGNGLGDVLLAINIDAAGRAGDRTAFSFYGASDEVRAAVTEAAGAFDSVEEGPEWPMSDHMVFAMRGVPAVAITSTGLNDIAATVAHTPADTPGLVDPQLVVDVAAFIAEVIEKIPAA